MSSDAMRPADVVVLALDTEAVEGALQPSCDTPTSLHLYREFPDAGGIVHTPSTHAVADAYEHHTGVVIVERFREHGLDSAAMPDVLVAGQGPFAWGSSPRKVVENAIALDATAQMALHTLRINPESPGIGRALLDKRHLREHGAGVYHGDA